MAHPHATLARSTYDALERGDLDAVRTMLSSDVVWHVPGDGPLAADYEGVEAVVHLFARIYDLSRGTYRPVVDDVVADSAHAVVLLTTHMRLRGGTLVDRGVHVARIADAKVAELWAYSWDQPRLDWLLDDELVSRS